MIGRIYTAVQRKLRYKLLIIALAPFAIIVPLVLAGAIVWSEHFSDTQLAQKVNTDLAVAQDSFRSIREDYLAKLSSTAESYAFQLSYREGDDGRLLDLIDLLLVTADFDFVHLTDTRGGWRFHANRADTYSKLSPLWSEATRIGLPTHGVEVYSQDELLRTDPELARRARLALVPSDKAEPTTRRIEDRALVLRAIYPIKDRQGQVTALLDAGVLLNGNFEFVDRIRDLVYGPGSVPEGGWGAVTVFLDDVRISTNVPLAEGERALGTRVSAPVRERVLDEGKRWMGETRDVGERYISAYEPILDSRGERVGILHTGFVRTPFSVAYYQALAVLVAVLILAGLVAVFITMHGARTVFEPLQAIAVAVRATGAGKEQRIGELSSRDEIGELARQFDEMLDQLEQQNQQIRQATNELEYKVEERTRELKEKNERLQTTIDLLHETRQQLALAEKLAALGQLTAGVAHEINNPIAVILGNMEVLINELGAGAQPVQTEIELVFEQVYRIRKIVERLLQYSRPGNEDTEPRSADVRTAVEHSLTLVQHELSSKRIEVETRFEHEQPVHINPEELEQVIINIVLNAVQASEPQGRLEISTRAWGTEGTMLSVLDQGHGLTPEQQSRVFDPFFTTRTGGTGLGLSVSYGIVRRYGGRIAVTSQAGKWTRFDVCLHTSADAPDQPAGMNLPASSEAGGR